MRIPVVTRTITVTEVELVCLNVDTGNTEICYMTFSRQPKDDYIMNEARKEFETDNFKVVYISHKNVFTSRYSMYESEFVKNARKID